MSQLKAIGIPWDKEEDYEHLKTIFDDHQNLPSTFQDWLNKAQNLADRIKSQGCIVEKVYIDPNTFPQWCRGRGLDINGQARIEFVNEFVARKYTH